MDQETIKLIAEAQATILRSKRVRYLYIGMLDKFKPKNQSFKKF